MKLLGGFFAGAVITALSGALIYASEQASWERERQILNERARHYALQYRKSAQAWQDLALQRADDSTMIARLRKTNSDLADDLAAAESRILALQEINLSLEATLDSSATSVRREDDNTLHVTLDESVALQGGGVVRVSGPIIVTIDPSDVVTDLDLSGQLPLTVVLSRDQDQNIVVNAFTGDPRLAITQLDVETNLGRPGPDLSFIDRAFDDVMGTSAWINRAIGAGVCLATTKLIP